jgi:hypothetical protein
MPPIVVHIDEVFNGRSNGTLSSGDDAKRQAIIMRIRNMLTMGLHTTSTPAEAANAMRLAQRELEKHNLTHAEVMREACERESADDKATFAQYCGAWRVTLAYGRREVWMNNLLIACQGFDAKAYWSIASTQKLIKVTFYGISMNAELAAHAFADCMRQIPTMTNAYAGNRFWYREGISVGLVNVVKEIGKERAQQQAKLAKRIEYLRAIVTAKKEPTFADDDDDDNVATSTIAESNDDDDDIVVDIEEASHELVVAERAMSTCTALQVYTARAHDVAKEALGVVLAKAVPFQPTIRARDSNAYADGKRDAKRVKLPST